MSEILVRVEQSIRLQPLVVVQTLSLIVRGSCESRHVIVRSAACPVETGL